MAPTIFDNPVDGKVLQSSVGSQDIAVACLAYSGRTGNNDVGLCPRHDAERRKGLWVDGSQRTNLL